MGERLKDKRRWFSRLVPYGWQPVIEGLDEQLACIGDYRANGHAQRGPDVLAGECPFCDSPVQDEGNPGHVVERLENVQRVHSRLDRRQLGIGHQHDLVR